MATKTKFNSRKMMEKAISVMMQSINEPRADKKASPLVGAVLLKPDGASASEPISRTRAGSEVWSGPINRLHDWEMKPLSIYRQPTWTLSPFPDIYPDICPDSGSSW